MRKNKVWINISATLIVTFISIAVTIFGLDVNSILVKIVYVILLVFLAGVVVAIYVHIAADDFRESKLQYEQLTFDLKLLETLPQLFVFKSRKDVFTILDNGDAELIWNFEIEKKTESKIAFINFPVICERRDNNMSMDFSSVQVKDLIVNGEHCHNAEYELKSIYYDTRDKRAVEQGCIHVPLYSDSEQGKNIHIKVILHFKDIFHEFMTKEFVVVDIPYITECLRLEVKPKSIKKHIVVTDNFFNVHEVNGLNTDTEEQVKQEKNCLTRNNTFQWIAHYPKLGYRYEISFKFIDRDEKNTAIKF